MSLLVTFHSVSAALYAQTVLRKTAQCTVVPVPRSVSSSCGYAIETSGTAASALAETMNGANVEWEAIYQLAVEGKSERYELLTACDSRGGDKA